MSTESTKDDVPERRAKLSPAKQALLEKRLRGKSAGGAKSPAIPRRTERSSAPLSFAQQRLWFLDQLQPGSPFYNVPKAVRLKGALDVEALHGALEALVARQESLRTTFATIGASPVQVIAPTLVLPLPVTDLSALPKSEHDEEAVRLAAEEALRPFDLARGPLVRTTLVRLGQEDHVLLLTMHHIISDGWSVGVLFRELGTLYEAFSQNKLSPLRELPIQYADYAVWQREWMQGEVLDEQLRYWRERLGGELPVLELPTDRPRPAVQSFRGTFRHVALPKELSARLKEFSQREGATLFMTLLAAFQTLLARYTGQDDIIVGSPIANRTRIETEELIGFFVNTLVMRGDLSGDPTFRQLLERVKEVALGAYAHQDLPFEMVVEELQPERGLSHNPLFQVMFALQNARGGALEIPGLTVSSVPAKRVTSKFDLALFMWEEEGALNTTIEYSTDLFDEATIERMLGHFRVLLEGIVADPEQPLSKLPLLAEAERRQLLVEWNDTSTEYPRDQTVQQLFEAQAAETPEAVAVVFEGEGLTYAELNGQANQVAHHLRRRGTGPDVLVGIMMERSVKMVVALLGILKAGGAYAPLDPAYPQERLAFMLRDTDAPVLLTEERLAENLPAHRAQVIRLDADWERIAGESTENPPSAATAESLAYVIYTSGSTGRPKGVAVTHRSIVRLVKNTNYIEFSPREVFLQFAPVSFDASTLELWGPLLNGARLVVFPTGTPSLEELSQVLREQRVSTLWLTAGLFHQMVDDHLHGLKGVRQLLSGGDVLSVPHVERVLRELPQCQLINGYGPTENTTFTCCYPVPAGVPLGGSVPIGRPIANTRVYILDSHLQPVPIGVAGELYIGGDGLARGYLGRPELTAERFIPDPFSQEPFSQEPGARLYRTGDRVRYLADGTIEFLGRFDHQVKVRGYRIELEEIEAVLSEHGLVEQAVVLAREDVVGDKRLVAYVTQTREPQAVEEHGANIEMQAAQVSQWQTLYEDLYSQRDAVGSNDGDDGDDNRDATFDITGWNSSYTGEPIPAEEMREWLHHTVERILSVKPRRVLEIGCGTGLLLFQVAPHCDAYDGTDFSQAVIEKLRPRVEARGLKHVSLSRGEATDFTDVARGGYDAVVINSVVQYFPSVDYLVEVLEGAVGAVAPGGAIFVGDVRNYELLEAFHASVELHRAAATLPVEQLRQRVREQVVEENELVIAPSFFTALKERMPRISRVEVLPKRGFADNELTRFRYDVLLHVGDDEAAAEEDVADAAWRQWEREELSVARVRELLEETRPELLGVARVPNERVLAATRIMETAADGESVETAGDVREALERARRLSGAGVNPEQLWGVGEELPYTVEVSWADGRGDGRFDVLWRRRATDGKAGDGNATDEAASSDAARGEKAVGARVRWPGAERRADAGRAWSFYANQPLARSLFRTLVPQLREYLQGKLPEYMMPQAFVLLDEMPLTPNGKVDRRALPAPDRARPELEAAYVAPRSAVEEVTAGIWSEVLDVEQVGVLDNFFELGGHSLKATQVISRLREALQVELPLRSLFQEPTVAGLTQIILDDPGGRAKVEKIAELMVSLAKLSEDEIDAMLDEETSLLQGGRTK